MFKIETAQGWLKQHIQDRQPFLQPVFDVNFNPKEIVGRKE